MKSVSPPFLSHVFGASAVTLTLVGASAWGLSQNVSFAQQQDGTVVAETEADARTTQEEDDAPPPRRQGRIEFGERNQGKVVADGPAVPGIPAIPGIAVNPGQNGAGRVALSRSNNNGNVKTVLEDEQQKIIVEESDLGVFIEQVRKYRRSDAEALREEHPKLAEALEAFPEQVGDQYLDLVVTATRKFEAEDTKTLENDQPQAFKLYQQVMSRFEEQGANGLANGFPFGADFGPDLDMTDIQAEMQKARQQMDRARQQMRQQMQQMQRNGQGSFQFNFGF